jgi:diguanylate cyclase (GGDEF)-like protein/PAS domain S-box-containing protein
MPTVSPSLALVPLPSAVRPREPESQPEGTVPDASLTLDARLCVLDASPGVRRLLGLPRPLAPGRPLADAGADRELLVIAGARAGTNLPHRAMIVRSGLDGRTRHLLVQVAPVGGKRAERLVLISDATRQVRIEDELLAASRVIDRITEGVLLIDPATWQVRQANAAAIVMLGLDSAELPGLCIERLARRLRTEDGTTPAPSALGELTVPTEYHYLRPDGVAVPIEVRVDRLGLARRDVLAVLVRDVGDRLCATDQLRAMSSRCDITFAQAATGLAHVTLDGRWARVNPRLAAILGYTEDELLALSVEAVTHPDDVGADAIVRRRMRDGELPCATREKRYLRKDGATAWVSVTSSPARSGDGTLSHFIAIVQDIGERKRAEERIRHLASHDVLTGLPNRAGLHEHLELTLEVARRTRRRLAVAFVDMDKLKAINDTLGHEEGDRALVRFARALQRAVRSGDLVARLGGDEFVVVLGDVSGQIDIEAMLRRTLFHLARPAPEDGTAASCSIGISIFPDDGGDARTLIRNADLAMYRAKQRGGSGYAFFADDPADVQPLSHQQQATLDATP